MIIKNLKLRNFRNYDLCEVKFAPHMNIILGMNAQGKTNLLEALVFLSTTRSFRMQYDQELIQEGKELANIECIYEDEIEKKVGAIIYSKGKTLLINGQPVKKSTDFIGKLNVIIFSPSDLEIFNDSPKIRRRLMDLEIGKISSTYMVNLSKYIKLLKDRNTLLKTNRIDDAYMSIIENQMIECQSEIIKYRLKFINMINESISNIYSNLSNEKAKITLSYQSSTPFEKGVTIKESYQKMFDQCREKDVLYKATSFGIHRDDIYFEINDKKVQLYASQGQKRMIVLALKLALVDYIYKLKGITPVLLLDDVLSELDEYRQQSLLSFIPESIQTIITTTDMKNCKDTLNYKPNIIDVSNGKIVLSKEDQA